MEHMNVYTTGCLMDYQVFPFSLVMFSVVFFPLKRTSSSSFTLLAKYQKKELKPNCKSSHCAFKDRRPFVGLRVISHSNNLF